MPRKFKSTARFMQPDPNFNHVLVTKFINCVMHDGKKLVAQKSAQDFELNTLSRSRDVKEEGYEHRIFVPSEKAQWTVAFPAYPDMSQDYTRELPNGGGEYFLKPTVAQKSPKVAPTAIDERNPAKSLAMKKIMMTKPRPGRGGGDDP